MVMKDTTPLLPLVHKQNSIFKQGHHTIYDPSGPETMMCMLLSKQLKNFVTAADGSNFASLLFTAIIVKMQLT